MDGDGAGSGEAGACIACGRCVEACPPGARSLAGREWTSGEVADAVERDLPFYEESGGGVTFSGGEPLRQPAFLAACLAACRERGIRSAVETCGYAPWEAFEAIRRDVDLWLYDLKMLDESRHRRLAGVSNGPILENLRRLSRLGHAIHLRVPILPGLNDDGPNLEMTGSLAASLPSVRRIDLLPYHDAWLGKAAGSARRGAPPGLRPPSAEAMARIAAAVAGASGLPVTIGG